MDVLYGSHLRKAERRYQRQIKSKRKEGSNSSLLVVSPFPSFLIRNGFDARVRWFQRPLCQNTVHSAYSSKNLSTLYIFSKPLYAQAVVVHEQQTPIDIPAFPFLFLASSAKQICDYDEDSHFTRNDREGEREMRNE